MSNQQWNQGQPGEWAPQPSDGTTELGGPAQQAGNQAQPAGNQAQPAGSLPRQDWGQQQEWAQQAQTSASEWGQPAPQPSAPQSDWTQSQPGQDWHQAQPQRSAGEWHQAQGGQDWNQQQWQGQQGWDQNQQGWDQNQQGWDQNQQWPQQQQQQWGQQNYAQAGSAYSAGQWQQRAPKKPSPFDFSFRRPALPEAAGTIFLVGAIGLGVWWLFRMVSALTYLIEYPLDFFVSFLGDAGLALFGIMLLRALLEVGVAVTSKRSDVTEPRADDPGREDTGTHTI